MDAATQLARSHEIAAEIVHVLQSARSTRWNSTESG